MSMKLREFFLVLDYGIGESDLDQLSSSDINMLVDLDQLTTEIKDGNIEEDQLIFQITLGPDNHFQVMQKDPILVKK